MCIIETEVTIMDNEEKKFKYIKNGPCDHDDYDEYASVLNEKINDSDVFNIGIISPYGGGKSSLLLRYKNHYADKLIKYIKTVSLANFVENENSDDEEAIEKSILEQLLYEAKHSTLPNSSIKRIHSRVGYLVASIALTVAIIATFVFGLLVWKGMIFQNLESSGVIAWKATSASLFLLLLASLIIVLVMSTRLVRIKYKEIELDFATKDGDKPQSILNHFIDELIYYFKQTKTRVVIFEDIDRFKTFKVFSKLRELNTILNENAELKRNKITFIYAINDGLFKDAEGRTKFFDYIISLLPIMNSSNSRDFMYDGLEGSISGKALGLDEIFISDISKFITEIRVMKSTLNDCLLYMKVLDLKEKDDLEKLFALMVYKNTMPEDFNNLQKENGVLYNLLNSKKEEAINQYISNVDKKIEEIDTKIEALRNDDSIISDFKELKQYVAGMILQNGIDYQQQNTQFQDIASLETFNGITNGICVKKSINETYYGSILHTFAMSIKDIENTIGESVSELEAKITGKNNEKIASLKAEKREIESTINIIRTMSVSDLMVRNIYTPALPLESETDSISKNNTLMLIEMLKKGYIDESYKRMLTKTNNSLLSTKDREVVYKIGSNQKIDPALIIDNPKIVLNDLKDYAFLSDSVFNFTLINHLFEASDDNKKKLNFINHLSKRTGASIQFIKEYCSNGFSVKPLLSMCANDYKELIFDLISQEDNEKAKEKIVGELLSLESIDTLLSFNIGDVLTHYFNSKKTIIESFAMATSHHFLCKAMSALKISVQDVDYFPEFSEEEKDTFMYIIENNLYSITKNNINRIARYYLGSPQVNVSAFYSTSKSIKETFMNNINEFIGSILDISDSLDEDTATIDFVLKSDEISEINKKTFIQKANKSIEYSADYSRIIIEELINNKKLSPNWESISLLFKEDNTVLLIKKHIEDNMSYYSIKKCSNSDILTQLTNEITFSSKKIFEDILNAFDCSLIPTSIIDDKKCSILVDKGLIDSDVENLLDSLNRSSVMEAMLFKNPVLINNLAGQAIPNDSILYLLKSTKLDSNKKHSIIIATQNSINVTDIEVASLILGIIADKDNSLISETLLITIYHLVASKNDKDAVKEIGYTYLKDAKLLVFAKEVDNEIIQSLSSSVSHKIDKTTVNDSLLYKALIRSGYLVIKRTNKINYSIDSSKLIG